jgi:hypothetical protein
VLIGIVYFVGGFFEWIKAPHLPFGPKHPKVSKIAKHGLLLTAHYHWDDEPLGKPRVTIDEETRRIQSVWAMLDIEVRNTGNQPLRVSDLYMQVTPGENEKRVLAEVEPREIDRTEWKDHRVRRRVEWLLEPHSSGQRHTVNFERTWSKGTGPDDPKTFSAFIVADLEGGIRQVKLELEDDIMNPPNEKRF